MVQTKLVAALCLLGLCGCAHTYTWEKYAMDSHRTGVTAVKADSNIAEALGKVDDGVYTAPNGTVFTEGSTPKVASALIDAQSEMAPLREVVGHCDETMKAYGPESPLSNWTADALRFKVSELSGRKADIGLINLGGIRVDMPKGEVTLDVINSMFPFDNKLCLVVLKGSDLKVIFDRFSKRSRPEGLSGVEYVIENGVTSKLLIGGKPFDEDAVYSVATIDFLLDGGDGIYLAKNAMEVVILEPKIGTVILDYVRSFESRGETIHGECDGRVKVIGGKRK